MSSLKSKLFFLFILCFLLQDGPVGAVEQVGAGNWEFSGWYGGGCYPDIIADPNVKNRIYLLSDVAGLWRSDNRADRWYFINNGLATLQLACFAVAPSNSDVLYLGSQAGIMRSMDAGKNWTFLETTRRKIIFQRPQSYRCLVVDPKDHRRVFAGSLNGQVFASADAGDSWTGLADKKHIFGKGPITALYLSRNGEKLFAASPKALGMYDLRRKKWAKIKTGFTGVLDMVGAGEKEILYAAAQNRVAYSQDHGKNWKFTSPVPRGQLLRLDVRQAADDVVHILAGWSDQWEGGLYLSLDKGKEWIDLERNLKYDQGANPTRAWSHNFGPANAVVFDPFDPQVLYFTDWWGVWRSPDSGNSWEEKISGAANTVGSDIAIAEDGRIYASAMDEGLLKSTDLGKSYAAIFPRQAYDPEINGHVWRVLINPKNPEQIIATSSPWAQDFNQVIFSENGGQDFGSSREGLPRRRPKINTVWHEGYPRAIAFDPLDPKLIYLGIDGDDGGGLFISKDSGRHWEYSSGQPAGKGIYNGLAVDPAAPERIFWGACGARGGVYLSEDKGKSWKLVFNQTKEVFDVLASVDGRVYAAGSLNGHPAVFMSADKAKTWVLLAHPGQEGTAEALCVNPRNPDEIVFSAVNWQGETGGKIYFSPDKGASWKDITGELPQGSGAAAAAFNPQDGHLYINRYSGSIYKKEIK